MKICDLHAHNRQQATEAIYALEEELSEVDMECSAEYVSTLENNVLPCVRCVCGLFDPSVTSFYEDVSTIYHKYNVARKSGDASSLAFGIFQALPEELHEVAKNIRDQGTETLARISQRNEVNKAITSYIQKKATLATMEPAVYDAILEEFVVLKATMYKPTMVSLEVTLSSLIGMLFGDKATIDGSIAEKARENGKNHADVLGQWEQAIGLVLCKCKFRRPLVWNLEGYHSTVRLVQSPPPNTHIAVLQLRECRLGFVLRLRLRGIQRLRLRLRLR